MIKGADQKEGPRGENPGRQVSKESVVEQV